MKRFIRTSILLFSVFSIPFLSGAKENLDLNFGNNGQLTTEFSIYEDQAFAITVQPDGRILVAGQSENGSDTDFAIARYLKNGKPDKSFNYNGQVTVAVGSGNDAGHALIVQEDGKILVAGTTDNGDDLDVAVIRLLANGLPDMDFSEDGLVTISLPKSDDMANDILLQKDGKIILAGTSEASDTKHIFLARLNSNGSLDKNFGTEGLLKVTTNDSNTDQNESSAFSAALQKDGRILLAGLSSTETFSRATLFSFLENGQIDQNFGDKGIVISGYEDENSIFYDLTILDDGSIRAAGATLEESYRSILLAGFTNTGSPDQTFARQGISKTDLGVDSVAYTLAVAKDGSIYLAGSGSNQQDTDFILLHFSATGRALEDTSPQRLMEEEEEEETVLNFSPLQIRKNKTPQPNYTLTDFAQYNDTARAIYIQDDGTILLAGSAENGKDSDFAVLRYSNSTTKQLAKSSNKGGIYTLQGKYIATTPPTQVTRTSAISGGYVQQHTTQPATTVIQKGVCYSISPAPRLIETTDQQPESQITSKVSAERATEADTPQTSNTSEALENLNPFKLTAFHEGCTKDGKGEGEFGSDIINLTPDTTYYIRAYAVLSASTSVPDTTELANTTTVLASTKEAVTVTENTVIYGNEFQFTTEDACFIATAAHGNINTTQVVILRQFRDKFLKPTSIGKQLINIYYHLSPPLAELISGHASLQLITRILLKPATAFSYLVLHPQSALQIFAVFFLMATLIQAICSTPFLRRKLQPSHGFTLIELLVVLVIIGILAGYVGPRIMGRPDEAKRTMAKAQITALETALESYKLDNGTFPSTEQGLQALVEAPSVGKLPAKWRKGGYMKKGKVPKDPWGNEYAYLSPGAHSDFDIISFGADNESGGEDADADINNWEIE